MTEQEFNFQQRRVLNFFTRLPEHFFQEERTFTGVLAQCAEPVPYARREELSYQEISEGLHWGKLWDSAWVRLDGEIPEEWAGREILFRLNLGGEVLVFGQDGVPCYGLTNTSVMVRLYRKEYLQYSTDAQPGRFSVWMEAAANGLFGGEASPDTPHQRGAFGTVETLRYGVFNREVWNLRLDLEVVMGLIRFPIAGTDLGLPETPAFPVGSAREKQIMAVLARAVDCYRNDPANASACREILREVLDMPACRSAMEVYAVGHAHIDTGWHWPVRESIRKCARTFASQLTLMEKYPDYIFGASQAQHYQFIKENYPGLYGKIRQRIQEGRWEVQGGMWVECDCNLTGGEALIRQFLHGKNFFRREFGVDVKNLWLPDVFGYSGALPQIIRKCGCDHFLTQKLSWNDTNKFPYHAFHWRGIDGTGVLSFFPPEDTYNATLSPSILNYGANNFKHSELVPRYLSLFGIGNGGGGPKEEYVERGLRCTNLEGSPKVRFSTARSFLKSLEEYSDRLPVWQGELYFERHRGTLTTHGRVKRGNRRCEEALAAVEMLYASMPLDKYPAEVLDRLWKILLLNQFHDILPGSSIRLVYERTHREHDEILAECSALIQAAGSDDKDALTCVNTLGRKYNDFTPLPAGWENIGSATPQKSLDGQNYVELAMEPFGRKVLTRSSASGAQECSVEAMSAPVLENGLVRYEFSADGELLSAYDKQANRELLSAAGNRFTLYNDIPVADDAWDINLCYRNEVITSRRQEVEISPVSSGPLFSEFICSFTIGTSRVRQLIRLGHRKARLDFVTEVDWKENRRMLRVAFPVDMRRSKAVYDIQYGFVERPTHQNTSWDQARFEVCMHKFADLCEDDYGVAILNDCKYGISIHDNVLDVNLLRAPVDPDPTADRGSHLFTYSILPHSGDFREAGIQQEAAALNRAPLMIPGVSAPAVFQSALECENEQVVIESVKRAEDKDALVLRLVERHGRPAECRLHYTANAGSAALCDMMEWNKLEELPAEDHGAAHSVHLRFSPFEIKTVIIEK